MNILMLIKDSLIGGVVSCSSSLALGLQNIGDFVVIGTTNGDGVQQLKDSCNELEIIDFDCKSIASIIKNYYHISLLIKKYNIDVIHCQNRLPALYAAAYCCIHRKTKYIWSNHLVPLSSSFFSKLFTRYGACAVAESIDGKEMLISDFGVPDCKVKIINLGTDLRAFTKLTCDEQKKLKESLSIGKHTKVILLYGRLAEVKGHSFLLESLKNKAEYDFVVIFPGINDEYKEQLLKKAREYGIEDKIRFPGYIKGSEYLSITDLMVLPSKQEGFGIVNVESFCMSVPVIRTRTAGFRDMEDCCFGVDYNNIEELSGLLDDFFMDDEKFKQKAMYAKSQIERFSLEQMVNKYHDVYRNAVKEDRS